MLDEDRVAADQVDDYIHDDGRRDWLDLILLPVRNNTSALTKEGQRAMRQDSMILSQYEDLTAAVIDPYDSIIPPAACDNSKDTLDILAKVNYLRLKAQTLLENENILFESYEEMAAHLKRGNLSDAVAAQYSYYFQIQEREPISRLIKMVKRGEIGLYDPRIDTARQILPWPKF